MVIYDMFVWEVCDGSVKFVDFRGILGVCSQNIF